MKRTTGSIGWVAAVALSMAGLWTDSAQGASCYVVPTNAAAAEPYDTWAKAATSIQTAVDYVGAHIETYNTVIVSNGTYNITSQILITNAITVRSFGNGVYGGLANASNTVVQGPGANSEDSGSRIFSITNDGAVLDGFTIRNGGGRGDCSANRYLGGFRNWDGHGVYMSGGLVRNCIIKENGLPPSNNSHLQGGGVFMDGGTVSNCTIEANLTGGGSSDGGGIYATGGQILSCRILGNACRGGDGGGIYASSASVLIRNCLIARNSAPGNGGGVLGGIVESCTIVDNVAAGSGGGAANSRVVNSIVCGNWTSAVGVCTNNGFGSTFENSCTWPKRDAGEGNVDVDPLFVNPVAGDYRLQFGPIKSPCIDTGANAAWMETAMDLDGKPRIVQNTVDRGAFECWPVAPQLQNGGVSNITDRSAALCGKITWPGSAPITLFLFHGPEDGGTNRNAWANEIRFTGARSVGFHDAAIAHAVSNRVWFYRCYATNLYGAVWADSTASFIHGAVEVKATKRESTEEKPAAFVISRPVTATNGPLAVYYTLGGTGRNGEDYDPLESPAIIPSGETEVRLSVVPNFNMGETRSKGVELTLGPGGYMIGVNNKASVVTKAQ